MYRSNYATYCHNKAAGHNSETNHYYGRLSRY